MLGFEAGTIALPLRTPLSHAAGATGDGDDTGADMEVEVELVTDVVDFDLWGLEDEVLVKMLELWVDETGLE